MIKHTEKIRLQKPTNCLNVFDHFVGLVPKGLIFTPTLHEDHNIIRV